MWYSQRADLGVVLRFHSTARLSRLPHQKIKIKIEESIKSLLWLLMRNLNVNTFRVWIVSPPIVLLTPPQSLSTQLAPVFNVIAAYRNASASSAETSRRWRRRWWQRWRLQRRRNGEMICNYQRRGDMAEWADKTVNQPDLSQGAESIMQPGRPLSSRQPHNVSLKTLKSVRA